MKKWLIGCTLVILVGLLALGSDRRAIRAGDGATPTPTMLDADSVVMDLGDGLLLIGKVAHEEYTTPKLTVDVCWPAISGGTGAIVDNFNTAVDQIIKDTVGSYKETTLQATPNAALPPEVAGQTNYITLWYEIGTANSIVVSLKFHVTLYTAGDAHPTEYSVTLNYDLKAGKVLALKDLFNPDADYLTVLSDYSIKTLKTAGKLFLPEGASPTENNYSRWDLLYKGLQITFDAGQVGPRYVGALTVTIPYTTLKPIINPDGVLAAILKQG